MGLIIILLFYNFSSNLQKYYLEIKNQYITDKTYLAVINKNGLWIKDIIDKEIRIINSSKINNNILEDAFITVFDENYNFKSNIRSNKIDIKNKTWLIHNASVYEQNANRKIQELKFKTNFNQQRIESLFSNLSSLSLLKLYDLRNNYKSLNYSLIDVDMQINKILVYPIFLTLMTIFSSIIMLNTKKFKSNTFKFTIGLFFSVVIYYISNFFNVMGTTERIPLMFAVFLPIMLLSIVNSVMVIKINDK